MVEIVAYASSTRPNHLWSAAQFNSALPKNRADADLPLVAYSQLIAAAPDLLKAAKATMKLFEYQGDDAADFAATIEIELEAVIAKAEGRS